MTVVPLTPSSTQDLSLTCYPKILFSEALCRVGRRSPGLEWSGCTKSPMGRNLKQGAVILLKETRSKFKLNNELSCLADWLSKYRPSNKETMNDEQEERNVKGTILTIVRRNLE